MWPTHTPKDRDGTAWQGHSRAWRGLCRVRVRWWKFNSHWYSRGRCYERGLYEKLLVHKGKRDRRQGGQIRMGGNSGQGSRQKKGKRGGVGVVGEEHGNGGFAVAVLGKEGDKAELGQEPRLGMAARHSF
jgi:hypothetical protein